MEPLLFVLAALAAATPFVWRLGRGQRWAWMAALALVAFAVGGPLLWQPAQDTLAPVLPGTVDERGFASSDACRKCHPGEYHTWHDSYHRRMTEAGRVQNVLAPFDGVRLENRGRLTSFERRNGDEMWVDMVDPAWELANSNTPPDQLPAQPPRVQRRVVMTTGSHHLQAYWVSSEAGDGLFFQVPWVFFRAEDRWIPSQDSFLQPPSARPAGIEIWNFNCTRCHTVGSHPGLEPENGSFASRTAELGIACEACHGPADAHVRAHEAPLGRYAAHLGGDGGDPTIVNPARLDAKRSAQVCGQCHSFFTERDEKSYLTSGSVYRPGDDLDATRLVVRYSDNPSDPLVRALLEREPDALSARFWKDGTIRTAGRDYNGLLESACFQKGELSCTTCHSMHDYGDRADQLAKIDADETCLSCHESYRGDIAAHTHHAAGSAGSRCHDCHMPHTTYGLFTAMRSHRIDSPSAKVSAETGKPNACNQCHLDRTLEWTSRHLREWYGQEPATLSDDERNIAASLLWLQRGDAAQRAIAAWTMGWQPALEASGKGWQAAFLSQLLRDPYAAVRRVAFVSLGRLPGYQDFAFDFVAGPEALRESSHLAFTIWQRLPKGLVDRRGDHVLIDAAGDLQREAAIRLIAQRDDRPIRIIE
jgi:hypothetical protein